MEDIQEYTEIFSTYKAIYNTTDSSMFLKFSKFLAHNKNLKISKRKSYIAVIEKSPYEIFIFSNREFFVRHVDNNGGFIKVKLKNIKQGYIDMVTIVNNLQKDLKRYYMSKKIESLRF